MENPAPEITFQGGILHSFRLFKMTGFRGASAIYLDSKAVSRAMRTNRPFCAWRK